MHEHHKENRSNLENPCIHKKAHCQMCTFLWALIWWTPNDIQPSRSDSPFRSSLCQTDSNKRFLSSSSKSSLNITEMKLSWLSFNTLAKKFLGYLPQLIVSTLQFPKSKLIKLKKAIKLTYNENFLIKIGRICVVNCLCFAASTSGVIRNQWHLKM